MANTKNTSSRISIMIFQSRARDSISRFVGWSVRQSIGLSLFTKHANMAIGLVLFQSSQVSNQCTNRIPLRHKALRHFSSERSPSVMARIHTLNKLKLHNYKLQSFFLCSIALVLAVISFSLGISLKKTFHVTT